MRVARSFARKVQDFLAPDMLDLVHASLNKQPALRPDVLALLRHPFTARYQAAPVDLRQYIHDLRSG